MTVCPLDIVITKHRRELDEIEPYALAITDGVMVVKGGGGFTVATLGNHDLFTPEWLAFWINEGLSENADG